MVRNYIKKNTRVPKYSQAILNQAIDEVKSGTTTVHSACMKYNIPKMTLTYRMSGVRGAVRLSQGRPTAIPVKDEEKLASCIKTMEKWGWGLSRKEVLDIVQRYVTLNKLQTPFRNNRPGEDWFVAFKRRHGLSLKKPQSVEYARKKCLDPFVIDEYFTLLEKTLVELKLNDKPAQIFNMDETSFCTDPSKSKVLGQRNRPSSRIVSGSGRENISVLFTTSASGFKFPPFIIFRGKNIWDEWMAPSGKGFPNTAYAASKNGWMEAELFLNFFCNQFLKHIGSQRPILLIYDGHSSHVDQKVVSAAIENGITILKLPPHSSHLLQPLDISVFRPLKLRWDEKLIMWQKQNIGRKLQKKVFSELIGNIWMDLDVDVIKSGFRKGGIFPFDSKVIPDDSFNPATLERWRVHNEQLQNVRVSSSNLARPVDELAFESNEIPVAQSVHSVASEIVSATPASSQTSLNRTPVSFETLLLETVKQCPFVAQRKKSRVARGAQVITATETPVTLPQIDEAEQETDATEDLENPGPSTKDGHEAIGSSSASNSTLDVIENTDEDIDWTEADQERILAEEYVMHLERSISSLHINDWIMVEFVTNKRSKFYVGQVLDFTEYDPLVKFTRKVANTSSTFTWPQVEDISSVERANIKRILPEPTTDRRGRFVFQVSFFGYNVL